MSRPTAVHMNETLVTAWRHSMLLVLGVITVGLNAAPAADWKDVLANRLPLLGHRNWIVIVDAAYPAQTTGGIEMILCEGTQTDVVRGVLRALGESKHVRPTIFLDRELESVPEKDAPGISEYRKELSELLKGQTQNTMLHEKIIAKLDEAGKTFKILMLKTRLTLPYTSVFIRLDCGYWSDEAEKRLRKAMSK